MNKNSYEISIEELEALKKSIEARISKIREENGVDFSDTFDELLKNFIVGLNKLIDDRIENDDDQSLWKIATVIQHLEVKIFNTLRNMA